jgi:hypothetical protein
MNVMPAINTRELRLALIAGAAFGAIVGMLASGPLGASGTSPGSSANTTSCGRSICENAVWLRTPVRFTPIQPR